MPEDLTIREPLAPGACIGGDGIRDGYVILGTLGRGGFADVLLARDVVLGRHVAVKVLHRARSSADERFQREARALSRLSHPHIVQVHAFLQATDATPALLVMEHVPGITLDRLLVDVGRLSLPDVVELTRQLASALAHAHAHGLVHRDVKPSNVLVERRSDAVFAKLLDFGLARASRSAEPEPALTQAGAFVGTPRYVAPEQALGEAVDGRADVYGLGVLATEAMTGRPPFERPTQSELLRAHVLESPLLPSQLAPALGLVTGGPVDSAIARALSKAPGSRFPDPLAFAEAFECALRDEGRVEPTARLTVRSAPSAVRTAWSVLLSVRIGTQEPDALSALVRLRDEVTRRGGASLGPCVGGLLALFEPRSHEDAVEQAIDAGLWLGSRDRSARVAIADGRVHLLEDASGPQALTGPVLAAIESLEARTNPGELRIAAGTARRVSGLFREQADGADFLVTGREPIPRALRPAVLLDQPVALVGREAELDLLRAELDQVMGTGCARSFLVLGPHGVGKSRLIRELLGELRDRPETFMLDCGRCLGPEAAPYAPLAQALKARAGIEDGDPAVEVTLKLDHMMRRWVAADPVRPTPEEEALVPWLGRIVGAEVAGAEAAGPAVVRGDAVQEAALADAVVATYRGLARRAPVLLFIDEVERADPGSLAVLARLACAPFPLLVLMASTAPAAATTVLTLEPFPGPAARQLVEHVLRAADGVTEALIDRLSVLSGGVPVLVFEMVHDLVDRGLLTRDPTLNWRAAPEAAQAVRVTGLGAAWAETRMQTLAPERRRLLEVAAVVGERFWPSLLATLVGSRDVGAALADLVSRGLLVARHELPVRGEGDLGFAWPALREVLLDGLDRAKRRELHRAIADWLVERVGGRPSLLDDVIAEHHGHAGEPEKALQYCVRAAHHALRSQAPRQAIERIRRLRALVSGQDNRTLTAALARACLAAGALDAVLHETEGLEVALATRARALEHLGRYAEAEATFREAADLGTGVARLHAEVGAAAMLSKRGDHEAAVLALVTLSQSLDALAASNPDAEEAATDAYRSLANAEMRLGRLQEARGHLERALSLAEDVNAPVPEVEAYNALGALHFFDDRPDAALTAWQSGLRIARRYGLTQHESVLLNNVGELYVERGALAEAREALAGALALHERLGSDQGIADTCRLLATCARAEGRTEEADALAERSLAAALRTGSEPLIATCRELLRRP